METYLHRNKISYWNKLVRRYKETYTKLLTIKDSTDNLKLKLLRDRLLNLLNKLKKLKNKIGLKVAGAALGMLLISSPLSAQNLNYGGVLKSSTPMNILGKSFPVTVGDINGDGGKDIILSNGEHTLYFFKDINQDYYQAKGFLPISFAKTLSFQLDANPFLIDFDSDGDADLFVGTKDGYIFYFENNNSVFEFSDTVKFNNNTNFEDNASIFLCDFNDDEKFDLFVGNKEGNITYYQGNGSLNFDEGVKLQTTDNHDIMADYAIPGIIDLDQDGHKDLLVGSTDKDIKYYHNDGSDKFEEATNLYADGLEIITDNKSNFTLYDMDDDGDLDLLVSFYEAVKYYKNDNGSFSFVKNLQSDQLNVNINGNFSFADIDNDNDIDLFIGTNKKVAFYKNDNNKFSFISYLKSGSNDITSSSRTAPTLYDFDNDGDFDLLLGTDTVVKYYENVNNNFRDDGNLEYSGNVIVQDSPIPVAENLNGDEYVDLYLANSNNSLLYYQNSSSGFQSQDTVKFNSQNPNFSNSVSFCFGDINGDGNKDIIVHSLFGSIPLYALNDGNGNFGTIDTLKYNGNKIMYLYGFLTASTDLDNDNKPEIYLYDNSGGINKFLMEGVTNIKNVKSNNLNVKIYSFGNSIFVDTKNIGKSTIKIYSVTGSLVTKKSSAESFNKFSGLQTGIYIVRVSNTNGTTTNKVFVQ